MTDPSQFYTGLVADLYNPLRAHPPDAAIYSELVRRSGEPALELGCGDGDPLLALRAEGLDVEGLDSSADMLERCRRRAAEAGIDVVLHHQPMEELDLPRRYRTIFLAGPTFNLLPSDELASKALRAIRRHLEQEGTALVPLFTPKPAPPEVFGSRKELTLDDGTVIAVGLVSSGVDGRLVTNVLRYERIPTDSPAESLERPFVLFDHSREGFRTLAEEAGFTVDEVVEAEGTFSFVLSAAAA